MAQYTTISLGDPLDLSSGSTTFRYIVDSGDLYLRQTLTLLGFIGVQGVDWDDVEAYTDLGGGIWRVGARDLHWVMDCTITGTGFAGAEDTDWGSYEKHKLN